MEDVSDRAPDGWKTRQHEQCRGFPTPTTASDASQEGDGTRHQNHPPHVTDVVRRGEALWNSGPTDTWLEGPRRSAARARPPRGREHANRSVSAQRCRLTPTDRRGRYWYMAAHRTSCCGQRRSEKSRTDGRGRSPTSSTWTRPCRYCSAHRERLRAERRGRWRRTNPGRMPIRTAADPALPRRTLRGRLFSEAGSSFQSFRARAFFAETQLDCRSVRVTVKIIANELPRIQHPPIFPIPPIVGETY